MNEILAPHEKMMRELDFISVQKGFTPLTHGFLRWRSDPEILGWLIGDFIKLYKHNEAMNENEQFLGPIFSVEISLVEEDTPKIIVAKFLYEQIIAPNTRALSFKEHWHFNHPVSNKAKFKIDSWNHKWLRSTPLTETIKRQFSGLEEVRFTRMELVSVQTAADIEKLVFNTLEELVNL